LGRKDHADTDYDATITSQQLDLIFIPTAYGVKSGSDGSDADYTASDRIADHPIFNTTASDASADFGNIDQLRAELMALQQAVTRLQSRLDTEGR
jgi:hypothetical protein